MWKPGDQKPNEVSKPAKNGRGGGGSHSKNSQAKKNNNNQSPKTPKAATTALSSFSMGGDDDPMNTSSPAAPLVKKRLSGGTMNMRFMKRKKETQEYEANRNKNSHTAPPTPDPAGPVDDSDDDNSGDDDGMELEAGGGLRFLQATPSDMYGMQADLMGRRSFGGFNTGMEEAWKESKASLEHRHDESKSTTTDEQLLKRYKDLVDNKNSRPGVVGNLKDKKRRKQGKR